MSSDRERPSLHADIAAPTREGPRRAARADAARPSRTATPRLGLARVAATTRAPRPHAPRDPRSAIAIAQMPMPMPRRSSASVSKPANAISSLSSRCGGWSCSAAGPSTRVWPCAPWMPSASTDCSGPSAMITTPPWHTTTRAAPSCLVTHSGEAPSRDDRALHDALVAHPVRDPAVLVATIARVAHQAGSRRNRVASFDREERSRRPERQQCRARERREPVLAGDGSCSATGGDDHVAVHGERVGSIVDV